MLGAQRGAFVNLPKELIRIAAAVVFTGATAAACYPHDPVPPCANVMNCGNPADPPPQPILFARKPDAGTDGATTNGARP